VFLAVQTLTLLFSLTVPNLVVFLRLLDRKFNVDAKNLLKQSVTHSKLVLQTILVLTDLSNCVSVSSNFDTPFLPDCTKFCSVSQVTR